jgi:uncharacterized membrane protein
MQRLARVLAASRWILVPALVCAYALASHLAMTYAGRSVLALLVVLGPLVAVGLAGLWASGQRIACAAGALALVLVMVQVGRGRGIDPHLLFLAQHAGAHVALGLWFGSTLRAGRLPLISGLAQRLHGALDAELATYTRHVTQAWTLYFFAMAVTSVLLFHTADFSHWSFFANLLTPVSAVLLFAGEYLLRYRLHPDFERVSFADGIRAYRSHASAPARANRETG